MSTPEKHKSKLHKGFDKQVERQYAKPREVKIKFPKINLPKNFKGKYKHYMIVDNSVWNGLNLIVLRNSFNILRVDGMYGKFRINNETGKYGLSLHGKQILRKKKEKRANDNTSK